MHSNSVARRHHTDEFKAKVLSACAQPGASISGIALAHGLNANLVRKWRSGRGVKPAGADHLLSAKADADRTAPPDRGVEREVPGPEGLSSRVRARSAV